MHKTKSLLYKIYFEKIKKCTSFPKRCQFLISKYIFGSLRLYLNHSEYQIKLDRIVRKLKISRLFDWIDQIDYCTNFEYISFMNINNNESKIRGLNLYLLTELPFFEKEVTTVKTLKNLSINSIITPYLVHDFF